jgi:hypothetical protein
MKDQKLCLYNVEWQKLRVSLLGNWAEVQSTWKNLDTLDSYISYGVGIQYRTRLWRVLNLLNAVRMGYSGQKRFNSEQSKMVEKFRDEIQERYEKSTGNYIVDSEDKIKTDWLKLKDFQKDQILNNLKNRLKLHSKSKHRDELRWFLKIVDKQ